MRVLLDECAPSELESFLSDHEIDCLTVPDAGWSGKSNGELLRLAESEFDVFITIDANLKYQQNVSRLKLAIIVIRARSNRLVDLRPHFSSCLGAIKSARAGQVVEVGP